MSHYAILILRIAAGIVGLVLLSTVFLYEDQHGRIQSSIEDLWIKVDDLQKEALSRHTAFMNVIAQVTTSAFDRIFGERFLGLQSIGVWICYSLGCLVLLGLVTGTKHDTDYLVNSVRVLFFFAYGTIPALISKRLSHTYMPSGWQRPNLPPWLLIWFSFLALIILLIIILPIVELEVHLILSGRPKGWLIFPLAVLAGVATAVFLFALFTSLLRGSLRRISTSTSPLRVSLIYFLNSIPLLTFYGLYKLLVWRMETTPTPTDTAYWSGVISLILMFAVLIGIFFNLGFALSAIIFVVLATTMLLHRLLWPMFERPLYSLQALGVVNRHKLFVAVGLGLITMATGKYEWLGKIIKKVIF